MGMRLAASSLCGRWLWLLVAACCFRGGDFWAYSFRLARNRLAIDYGPNIVGVASADITGKVVPRCAIRNRWNLTVLAEDILDLGSRLQATEYVVGVPLTPGQSLSHDSGCTSAQVCLNFSQVLASVAKHQFGERAKVLLYNERFTTQEAKMRLEQDRKEKVQLDAMAATCILERFLEGQGKGSLLAMECAYPPPASLERFDIRAFRKIQAAKKKLAARARRQPRTGQSTRSRSRLPSDITLDIDCFL